MTFVFASRFSSIRGLKSQTMSAMSTDGQQPSGTVHCHLRIFFVRSVKLSKLSIHKKWHLRFWGEYLTVPPGFTPRYNSKCYQTLLCTDKNYLNDLTRLNGTKEAPCQVFDHCDGAMFFFFWDCNLFELCMRRITCDEQSSHKFSIHSWCSSKLSDVPKRALKWNIAQRRTHSLWHTHTHAHTKKNACQVSGYQQGQDTHHVLGHEQPVRRLTMALGEKTTLVVVILQ